MVALVKAILCATVILLVTHHGCYYFLQRAYQPCSDARRLSMGEILDEGECLRNGNAAACVRREILEATVEGEITFRSHKRRRRWWGRGRAEVVDGDLVVWERHWRGMRPHRVSFSTKTSKGDYLWLSCDGTLKLYSEGLLFDSIVWSSDECNSLPEQPPNLSNSSSSSSIMYFDKVTGVQFAQIKTFPGTKFSAGCIGAGERAKKIAGLASVNVYTVALYVEQAGIEKQLKRTTKSSSPLTTLLNGSFRMVAHLHFVRDVDVGKVADGLSCVKGVDAEPLAVFRKAIVESVGTKMKAGESISLVWLQHSELLIVVRDQISATIRDSKLPVAVFDMYLGEDPVSPPAKRSFEDGLKNLLL